MFITHRFREIFQELTKCHAYHNALSHDSQARIELWSSTKSIHSLSHLLFSHSIVSNSLWPHGLQHARLPCPAPIPGACSNACPSSQWCHPTISPSVIPFSCLQSFPESGSFPMSQFFASGSQNIGASASASVLPVFHIAEILYPFLLTSVNKDLPWESLEIHQWPWNWRKKVGIYQPVSFRKL